MKRHVVECVWSGYRASQSRPCHRTIVKSPWKVKALAKLSTIAFTDGTTMSVTVRPCVPREKVPEIHGYDSLLDKCIYANKEGYVSVLDVND